MEGFFLKSAGKLNKEMPLTTTEVSKETFAQVRTREAWLNNAILVASRNDDMTWSLLSALRQQIGEMEKRIRSGLPPIEEAQENEPDDPMDEMGDCGGGDPNPRVPPEKKRKERFIPQVIKVQMHKWPPEAQIGPSTIMREVRLFLEGNGKLWIHWQDLDWLVRSIWINFQLKDVANVAGTDKGPGDDQTIEPCVTPEKRPRPLGSDGFLSIQKNGPKIHETSGH